MRPTYSGVTQLTTMSQYTEKITGSNGLLCLLIYSSDDSYSQTLYQNLVTMSNSTDFNLVQFFAINLINNAVRTQLLTENALTQEKSVVRFYFRGKRYKSFYYDSSSIVNAVVEIKAKLNSLLAHDIII